MGEACGVGPELRGRRESRFEKSAMSGDKAEHKPGRKGFSLRPTGAVLLISNPQSLL